MTEEQLDTDVTVCVQGEIYPVEDKNIIVKWNHRGRNAADDILDEDHPFIII